MHKALLICLILCLVITSASAKPAGRNIMETAVAEGNFKTLVMALETSGLNVTLNGTGPFTLFAPTDAAFAKIPKAQLATLMANKTKLKAVLAYHMVPGELMSTDLTGGMLIKTLRGDSLTIKLANGGVMVNNATIVRANIGSTNGVIHAIDTVLVFK
jgi:uncharacterized surface protein with fasciclin (FAS1) repeats